MQAPRRARPGCSAGACQGCREQPLPDPEVVTHSASPPSHPSVLWPQGRLRLSEAGPGLIPGLGGSLETGPVVDVMWLSRGAFTFSPPLTAAPWQGLGPHQLARGSSSTPWGQ